MTIIISVKFIPKTNSFIKNDQKYAAVILIRWILYRLINLDWIVFPTHCFSSFI